MASKTKKARLRTSEKSGSYKIWLVLVVVITVLLVVGVNHFNKVTPVVNANGFTIDQILSAEERVNSEIELIIGENPISKRFPINVRQRIAQMIEMKKAGRLRFEFNVGRFSEWGSPFMASGYDGDLSRIIVSVYSALEGMSLASDERFRTSLVAALYHEIVHLENPPSDFKFDKEDHIREEIRAYSRTSMEAVRPMLSKGLEVGNDLIRIEKVLAQCNDDPTCPAFRQVIIKQTRGRYN